MLRDADRYVQHQEGTPWYGYRYRMLQAQGPGAPGGAYNYEVNGHLVGGFGLVAWPAEYGSTGVMTLGP
ncbi:MAG: DUF2950 family protein [Armatimonadetes bacterium]|nr:DUF2950 family protein [Armatimonadota bacterium]